jgi:uncharacterized glyoxalase superfamily protein PhnB
MSAVKLPPAVPELPVRDTREAARFYCDVLGFHLDWTFEDYLAGVSRDDTRIFLRQRQAGEDAHVDTIWLNATSVRDVDALYAEWKEKGVSMVKELHTAPYKLREFTAADPDGNRMRVFHDVDTADENGS